MKMTSMKMKRLLEERWKDPAYRTSFNRDKDQFRIEWKKTKKGITIQLPQIVAKYNERGEEAINELIEHIETALKMMNEDHQLSGKEKEVFPVIRSTSFPSTSNGKKLVTKEHTAETRIFYALDLGNSYRLIDEEMISKEGWSPDTIHEMALFNLRSLKVTYTQDIVRDNTYYFISTQDGYDASRILYDSFLLEMKEKCSGDMVIAVPHQDVLIIGDIHNDTGYDVLAQMTMKFFAEGRIPITSLAFIYEERKLEPIFIMARNRPKDNKDV